MRRVVLALVAVAAAIACSKPETATPPAPTPAPTPAPAPAAPAALTEAAVSGTWTGTVSPATSDSVIGHWTMICGSGACKGIQEGSKDTVNFTYTLAADSMMGTSAAHKDKMAGGASVVDHWVGRLKDGKVMGAGHLSLAAKPDSVLMKYKFSGARKS